MAKRFINIVIDSLNPVVLVDCINKNKTPALKFLADNGRFSLKCISCFPTMTPVAAASIATGSSVDQHGVAGFIWYNQREQRKINYGATKRAVAQIGVLQVVNDLLFSMNNSHLNVDTPTIFELLENRQISTGAVNFFSFRGTTEHQVKVPWLINIASGFKLKGKINGPSQLVLGKLVNSTKAYFDNWQRRFGFNDYYTYKAALAMLSAKKPPSFLMLYFPDNDSFSHKYGPFNTQASIMKVDKYIGEILSIYGSWHKAIRENVFLVLGDHSQSQIYNDGLALIDLDRLTKGQKESVVICPNERMAYLHLLNTDPDCRRNLVQLLAKDDRIGIIAWKENTRYFATNNGCKQKLEFWSGDQYLCSDKKWWNIKGDIQVVDGKLAVSNETKRICFGDYPAAFSRLASALNKMPPSTIILSAKSGYEFSGSDAPTHLGGGSHGSLHKDDSYVPLIITGSDLWPSQEGIDYLQELWCQHFGINHPTLKP
ncbi:MAG: alkaline phosphatase family protein [Bacillota bacterium]|nr:alkaline phosphatase family protein [Bacillota bacterium]